MLRVRDAALKKKIGIAKALDPIPRLELEELMTGALLARLQRLRWCYENIEAADDYTTAELSTVKDKILFKSDPNWKAAYRDLKEILASRKNVK